LLGSSCSNCDAFWCRKIEQIAEEAESLKDSLEKYNSRNHKRMMEAKERAELLGRAVCDCYLVIHCIFV
jgi:hypothetical protein